MNGTIFKISRFCTDDGPGIRTAVFLKGCSLRCEWCHNPEGLSKKPQIMFDGAKCAACGKCAAACAESCHTLDGGSHFVNFERCKLCGKCVDACALGALAVVGQKVDAKTVVERALKDSVFYKKSGGGVTLTGGEVLCQAAFAAEILKLLKQNGIHTCVETSGAGSKDGLAAVAEFTDLFLFDFKHYDAAALRRFCGADYSVITANLKLLNEMQKPVVLRCPIIGGVNDSEEHMRHLAQTSSDYSCVISAELLPYHGLGAEKAQKLGFTQNKFYTPDKERLLALQSLASSLSEKPIELKI